MQVRNIQYKLTMVFLLIFRYATPAKTSEVKTYKPFSTNILNSYNLARYERTVQVRNRVKDICSVIHFGLHFSLEHLLSRCLSGSFSMGKKKLSLMIL